MNESQGSTHVVMYDDRCSFCTFQIRMISWLDFLHKLSFLPMSDPGMARYATRILPEALEAAIHCETLDGRILKSMECVRFICARLPLGWPIALLLWIPGVLWLAERFYRWVSRNRYLISRVFGCDSACAVLPMRERSKAGGTGNSTPAPRV